MKLGYVNVDSMLRCITIRQLKEWQKFAELEPFDEERADIRAAAIAHTMANMWRGKNVSPYKLADFIVRFGDSQVIKKTWQQLKETASNIVHFRNK